MNGSEIKDLKVKVGARTALAEGGRWAWLNSGGIQAGKIQRGRHSVLVGVRSTEEARTKQEGKLQN